MTYIIEYCLESRFIDRFMSQDAFDAYNIALEGLPKKIEIKLEVKEEAAPAQPAPIPSPAPRAQPKVIKFSSVWRDLFLPYIMISFRGISCNTVLQLSQLLKASYSPRGAAVVLFQSS